MGATGSYGDGLIEDRPSPMARRWFMRYACRLLRKQFASVRLMGASREALQGASSSDGPLIMAMNHASWWDPILGAALVSRFFADRPVLTPIDRDQLERFRFMRRLGMFGIDPAQRDALRQLTGFALARFEAEPRSLLCITPQGAFTDVRAQVRVRPGAAAVASQARGARVVLIACEYTFWQERRPEIFLRAAEAPSPANSSTGAWRRAIEQGMAANGAALAEAVIARDASAFEPMLAGAGAHVHPVYDVLLRLRGQSARIEPRTGRTGNGGTS